MWQLALLPFMAQAMVIFFDEFYFHIRRGLPRWERIGHPLDTLTVILCMAYVLWIPFSKTTVILYGVLALFSSLFVTKDEFVHNEHCPASEQWLHALLFLLHPITLITAGFIWPIASDVEVPSWLSQWLNHKEALRSFLIYQLSAMSLFFFYQIIYWNFIYDHQQ